MPEYLAPGVFIEEIEPGAKPVAGVSTSTVAFLGETARGPVDPELTRPITSYREFLRYYGGVFAADKYMPYAVKGFFDNGGKRCHIFRIVGQNAQSAEATIGAYTVRATGPGVAGNRTWIRIGPGTTKVGVEPIGFRLQVYYWDALPDDTAPFDPIDNPERHPKPSASEDFDDLSLDEMDPAYWGPTVGNGNSALVELEIADSAALPMAVTGVALRNGADGEPPTVTDFEGAANQPADSRGLDALDLGRFRDVTLVQVPAASAAIVKAVISHCEKNRYRFAVVDSAADAAELSNLDPRNDNETEYAAFYYPWIYVSDPSTGARTKVPPGGHVCGIYAKNDISRGVWKAPANVTVAGALDVEFEIDRGQQEILNPRGVNVIRRIPGRGIRVWGARTLSSDPQWKYIGIRRLMMFLEASIDRSTRWVVFEPNDQRLWAAVRQSITQFLRSQWREGALLGSSEEEAFWVAVGRETMSEADILNGSLIIQIGIAVLRPAEFVTFRINQKTKEADT